MRGKLGAGGAKPNAPQDHPRGCGENLALESAAISLLGSPPRMRGKPARLPFATCARRITPADAGKTASTDSTLKSPDGSPPRMRGKPSLDTNRNNWRRITPADAGKTTRQREHVCSRQDHPRGCGENPYCGMHPHLGGGSPPRMRGKHIYEKLRKAKNRITPADAGKTFMQ